MTKKKKIILVLLILLGVVASFISGQVYGKYMSRVTGMGSADIAGWSFKVNDNTEKIQTISLISSVDNNTLVNNKIAPGTKGSFQVKLDATNSDVGINYIVKFQNESSKPENLKFKYDDRIYNSVTDMNDVLVGTINASDDNKDRVFIIDWEWQYETGSDINEISNNDFRDTENAKNIKNYTFDIIVTGTQVMPED